MEEGCKLAWVTRTAKDPVRLRRAIVVMMSGQGQAVRDITSLLQTPRPAPPAVRDLRTTPLGHDRDQLAELTRLQTGERDDPLRTRRGDHLHHHMINYGLDQPIRTHPNLRDIT